MRLLHARFPVVYARNDDRRREGLAVLQHGIATECMLLLDLMAESQDAMRENIAQR